MTKKGLLIIIVLIIAAFFVARNSKEDISIPKEGQEGTPKRTWQIRSADTMKYSRDLSLEKNNDPTFDQTINSQVKGIKNLNATHVAIGTPYDQKFNPMIKRWVKATREENLNVWFRGNFSSWQGWFGEDKSENRQNHTEMIRSFIKNNPGLFEDGDIFSPCPECENGGPGDPRANGDVVGHRRFLIDERNAALEEFEKIGKKVMVLDSMNFDVAQLVMDQETAKAMGGIILIDHYVKTPESLEADVKYLAAKTGAKIMLGEFGAPIPDIHGKMTDEQQAEWIENALALLKDDRELIGLNYWVSVGGSTAIFKGDNTPKPAAQVLKKYFSLPSLD